MEKQLGSRLYSQRTNLYTLFVEQTQEVKRGKVNALLSIYNHLVAWRAVKRKTLKLAAQFAQIIHLTEARAAAISRMGEKSLAK